jgi:hypothetical protein
MRCEARLAKNIPRGSGRPQSSCIEPNTVFANPADRATAVREVLHRRMRDRRSRAEKEQQKRRRWHLNATGGIDDHDRSAILLHPTSLDIQVGQGIGNPR